jgi:hypothetical protein
MERSASQDKVFNSVIARGQNLRREGDKLGTFASAARHMAQRKRKINAPLQSGTRGVCRHIGSTLPHVCLNQNRIKGKTIRRPA